MKTAFTMRYDHPVERVWPFVAEPERWLEYVPALVERTRLDDGPVAPGSRWRSVDRVGPVRVEFTDELVELEPLRRVVFEQSSPWNSRGGYRLEPDGGGTILHVRFEGRPSGRIWWLRLVPDVLATRIFRSDMERLADTLDRRQPA